jgi:D-glycero-D-manno-heptose 1,7-bisphosphate phosphatase
MMQTLSDKICAVIMAGGKGTRLASLYSEIPKPMVPVCGKPILEHQIEVLRRQGITRVILSVGHMYQVIEDYFGDGSGLSPVTGEPFAVHIQYVIEKEPLGTAGALYYMKEQLREDFLLLNGDLIFDIDLGRFYQAHIHRHSLATIWVHPNDHPYDSGIIVADAQDRVVKWLHKEEERHWFQNRVNAGLHFLSPEILNGFTRAEKKDLDRDILRPIISTKGLHAYYSSEYVKDLGTPTRLAEVEADVRAGRVSDRNLIKKQRAIFLDRDGTINRYVGFLRDVNDFILIDGVAEAIRRINQRGYLAIVVTNQPVIARGEVSWDELREIHNKMETLLGEAGAYVDDIFICPHHPDRGFQGERTEYKVLCDCRKPAPGLLFQAAEKYNIDLASSWMVGDQVSDMEAGVAAGCHVALVGEADAEKYVRFPDLSAFIDAHVPVSAAHV